MEEINGETFNPLETNRFGCTTCCQRWPHIKTSIGDGLASVCLFVSESNEAHFANLASGCITMESLSKNTDQRLTDCIND